MFLLRVLSLAYLLGVEDSVDLKPCPNQKCLRPNTFKHCLVTKHVDVELRGQKVSLSKLIIVQTRKIFFSVSSNVCQI